MDRAEEERKVAEDRRKRIQNFYSCEVGKGELAVWLRSGKIFSQIPPGDAGAVAEHNMVVRFLERTIGMDEGFYGRLAEFLLSTAK